MKRFMYLLLAIFLLTSAGCSKNISETPGSINGSKTTIGSSHSGIREVGEFHLACYDATGALKWTDVAHNSLTNEGQYLFLDVVLRGGTAATQFYVRLFNDTPVITDTISTLTGEPSGTYGYAAQLIEKSATGWPTLALDSGNQQATSSVETITASGGSIGPVTYACLTTSTDSSGKLVSFAPLSQSRTLAAGDSIQITYKVKLTN